MKRWGVLIYGTIGYVSFLATSAYLAAWLSNLLVPNSVDRPVVDPWNQALLVNVLLIALFGLQHSIMARPTFKNWWTRMVPKPIERSTYVLFTNLTFAVLFWQWRPMGTVIWDVQHPAIRAALFGLFAAGWLTVLVATFLIDHFDLFGMRQVWLYFRGREYAPKPFVTPGPYRLIRHPLYVGWLTAFWATPTMTAGHLVFALGTAAYIFVAIWFEERNLLEFHGARYAWYRNRTPMLIPFMKRVRPTGYATGASTKRRPGRFGQAISRLFLVVLLAMVMAAGCTRSEIHHWAHGWSEQQSTLRGGKLLSFSTSEQTNTGKWQKCLCHVLLVYPEKSEGIRLLASGRNSSGGDSPYFRVHWRFQQGDATITRGVELRYDLAAGKLHIEGQALKPIADQAIMAPTVVKRSSPGRQPFSVNHANLFVVSLAPDYSITDIHPVARLITEMVTLNDFKRLLPSHAGVQRITQSKATASLPGEHCVAATVISPFQSVAGPLSDKELRSCQD